MGKRMFPGVSQKRQVVKNLVYNPKWSELHPACGGKPEKVVCGQV